MAFESRIYALRIEAHPNADRLELAAVGGYRCVVGKDSYADGDLAAYVPEGAVCPDWLIAELGLEGKLAGSSKNRVKAVKLRGMLSQGLVYPVREGMIRGREVAEGDDVTELLELVKYEPPIPIAMQGEVHAVHGATLHYDIEDFKKYPDELRPGEPVAITEKLHGTWCCLGWHPDHGPIVTSKGMSDKGLALILDDEVNRNNLYVRTWHAHAEAFGAARTRLAAGDQPLYVLGEVYGRGVQDLHYGKPNPAFAVFDAYVGDPGSGRYLGPAELTESLGDLFPIVPRLYEGPFSLAKLQELTDGVTALGGSHVREGAVVKPATERVSPQFGRVILKSVSGKYLTRRGGTEYN
jgi:RNA ligase (TIGR02306 family)